MRNAQLLFRTRLTCLRTKQFNSSVCFISAGNEETRFSTCRCVCSLFMNLFDLRHSQLAIVINSNSLRAAEIKPVCCNDALLNLYFRLYDCCFLPLALIKRRSYCCSRRTKGAEGAAARVLRHLYTLPSRQPAQAAPRTHTLVLLCPMNK